MLDAIVLGAGASGLAAAARVGAGKWSLLVVEARPRLGGRIHTLHGEGWPIPIEAGAEFLHGRDPHLMRVVKAGKLHADAVAENHWLQRDGRLSDGEKRWSA